MTHRRSDWTSNALSDVPAGLPTDDATAWQNGAGQDSKVEPSFPPQPPAAGPQPACAPLLHRSCTDCGFQEEDWTRSVQFACLANNGGENFAPGRALFDTGANVDNLLSLDFVTQCHLHFEPCTHLRGMRLPWWKCKWFKVFGRRSQATCYTADQRPIAVVGVVENLRWRGIPEPRCNSGLHFPQRFLDGRFLVVENLAYDAIFSSKTMNDAGLRGSCIRTVAVTQRPNPTKDSSAARKSEDAKKEQKKIQQSQEKAKRDDKGKNKPSQK